MIVAIATGGCTVSKCALLASVWSLPPTTSILLCSWEASILSALPHIIDAQPYPTIDALPYLIIDALPYPTIDALPYLTIDAQPYFIINAQPYPTIDAQPYLIINAQPYPTIDALPYPLEMVCTFERTWSGWT